MGRNTCNDRNMLEMSISMKPRGAIQAWKQASMQSCQCLPAVPDAHLHAAAAVAGAARQAASAAAAATAAALAVAAVAGEPDAASVLAAGAAPEAVAAAVAAAAVAAAIEQSAAAGEGFGVAMHPLAEQNDAAAAVKACAFAFGRRCQKHIWIPGCYPVLLAQKVSNRDPELRWDDCLEGHMLRSVACYDSQMTHQEPQRVKHGEKPHTLLDPLGTSCPVAYAAYNMRAQSKQYKHCQSPASELAKLVAKQMHGVLVSIRYLTKATI